MAVKLSWCFDIVSFLFVDVEFPSQDSERSFGLRDFQVDIRADAKRGISILHDKWSGLIGALPGKNEGSLCVSAARW